MGCKWLGPRLGSLNNELQVKGEKQIYALTIYQATGYQIRRPSQRNVSNYLLPPVLVSSIKRSAEAEAAPNRFADTNPTTRVLKFARLYCT